MIGFHDIVDTSKVGISEYVPSGTMSIILSQFPAISHQSSQSRFNAQIVTIFFSPKLWVFW